MTRHLRQSVLAIALLAALSFSVHSPRMSAQEPKQPAAGAAQPRANEQNPDASKYEAEEGSEVKNSSAVRTLARLTGLSNSQAYWLSIVLNFGIVVLLIAWLIKKKVPGMFRSRTELIQKAIEEARKTSEEAGRRLKEVEARLSKLDSEIGDMRREAEENVRLEEKRLQAEVEDERRRIVTAAEQEIDALTGAARRELKAFAAELSVDLAEKKIRVSPDTDQALVREFTTDLGKDGK